MSVNQVFVDGNSSTVIKDKSDSNFVSNYMKTIIDPKYDQNLTENDDSELVELMNVCYSPGHSLGDFNIFDLVEEDPLILTSFKSPSNDQDEGFGDVTIDEYILDSDEHNSLDVKSFIASKTLFFVAGGVNLSVAIGAPEQSNSSIAAVAGSSEFSGSFNAPQQAASSTSEGNSGDIAAVAGLSGSSGSTQLKRKGAGRPNKCLKTAEKELKEAEESGKYTKDQIKIKRNNVASIRYRFNKKHDQKNEKKQRKLDEKEQKLLRKNKLYIEKLADLVKSNRKDVKKLIPQHLNKFN